MRSERPALPPPHPGVVGGTTAATMVVTPISDRSSEEQRRSCSDRSEGHVLCAGSSVSRSVCVSIARLRPTMPYFGACRAAPVFRSAHFLQPSVVASLSLYYELAALRARRLARMASYRRWFESRS